MIYFGLWIIVVFAFSVYGFLHDGQPYPGCDWDRYRLTCAWHGILSWGGLGAGIATCGISACLLLPIVRRMRLSKPLAVFIFVGVCFLSLFIPPFVMGLPNTLQSDIHPFAGESGLIYVVICILMLCAAVGAVIGFILCVIFVEDLGVTFDSIIVWFRRAFPIENLRPSVTAYRGLRCVACEEPINHGTQFCPKCGYTQPMQAG